jgi:hypothetical protein
MLVKKIFQERDIGSKTNFVEISTIDTQITLGKFDDSVAFVKIILFPMVEDSLM